MSLTGGALIFFLLAQSVKVTLQGLSPPDYNLTFPQLPQDFKEKAKMLMIKCYNNGYSPPSVTDYLLNSSTPKPQERIENPMFLLPALLSSLPPLFVNHAMLKPTMGEPLQQDTVMNITGKMRNCTNLPQMIEFMRNTTENVRCFLRAFVAPLSWAAVLQNSSQLSVEQLRTLLWAARPFLEAASSSPLTLPPRLQGAQLAEMMKLFSEVFGSLSEERRDEISRWMKERVMEIDPVCLPNQIVPSVAPKAVQASASTSPNPVTSTPSPYTDQMNEVASGNNTSNRARRSLAVRDAKVVELPISSKVGNVPVNQQNSNKPAEIPANQQNPNKPTEIPANQQNPNKPTEIPANQQNSNKSAEISVNQQNPNKPAEIPGNQQNPNKPAEIPANQQNPNKPAEIPANQQNPNKPTEIPANQQNPNKPTEIPANQTKTPRSSNDTSPQTAGNPEKNPNKVEKLAEQENKKENIKETVTQSPDKQDSKGKEAGFGDSTNYNKGQLVTKDSSTVKQGKGGNEEKQEGEESVGAKERKTNSFSAGCPRKPWLKIEILRMMGRFFLRLPEMDLRAIQTDELCKFFQTPEFPSSFAKPDGLPVATGRMFLHRLRQECFNSSQTFSAHLDRLGSLICFYDDASSLNATLSKWFLSQLVDCDNTGNDQIRRELGRKVLSEGVAPPTLELLRILGSGVSILPPSKLSDFSEETLRGDISSLSQASWNPAQAKILAKKLLEKVKDITGDSLLSLGSIVRGVESEVLRRVQLKGLLGNDTLKNMTEKMSYLQKKAVLEAMRSSVNESNLVREVPDCLLASLSLVTLEKAGLNSVDHLNGRGWTRTQSIYLLKKILGPGIKPEQIRNLGQAVQGITCSMINGINQSDILETVQILSKSSNFLSRIQVHCIAQKLFQSLELQRPGYFSNVSDSELQAIPALLLIHFPVKAIQGLPAKVCPRFLEKMSQANLSSLPNSAPSRSELRDRALSCLRKNASDLSAAEVSSLGPLVCELDPVWMSSLNAAVLNSTLQALTSCRHIPRPYRAPLFTLIKSVYGDPSIWTEDTMKLLGPLLLLNNSSLETLPFKSWLKASLSDLLASLQNQSVASAPEEFSLWPDLLALRRKLFQLKTQPIQQRRRRQAPPAVQPVQLVIEDLGEGNAYWSPAQLASMTVQTFRQAMHVLGDIRNYTSEQLAALRQKAIEAWGDVSLLNQTQIVEMGCISQGFNSTELQNLNITSLDTLELLSSCHWNDTQKVAVWKGFVQRTGIKMSKIGAFEMVGMGHFICGLQPDEIDQLSTGEFKEAVEDVGRARCPVPVLECLKRKCMSAFGSPKGWGEAEVIMMGNIIAGLNGTELASLNSSVLPFIRPSAIALILPERMATLSVGQLKSLGTDNAAMVTESQRSAMGVDQRAAVDDALGVPTPRSTTSTNAPVPVPLKGGAPKELSVLGIAMLPAALLLLGFII